MNINRAIDLALVSGIVSANIVAGTMGIGSHRASHGLSGGCCRGRVDAPRAISLKMVGGIGVSGPGFKSLIR